MAVTLETVKAAIQAYTAQGKDIMAKQHTPTAISGAMVAAWLIENGHGTASSATLAKYINQARNATIEGEREATKQAPLPPDTLAKIATLLESTQSGITTIVQQSRQAAIDEVTTREGIYAEDEATLQDSAAVQLSDANAKIKDLEAKLEAAKDEGNKAQGRIEALEGQLATAQNSIDTATAKVREELTAEFAETRKALETKLDQLTRENGRIPDLEKQVESLTGNLAKAEELREDAHKEYVELSKSAENQSRSQHGEIVRLTREKGEQIQSRIKAETERDKAIARATTAENDLATTKDKLAQTQEAAKRDLEAATKTKDQAIAERDAQIAATADLKKNLEDLQRRYEEQGKVLADRNERLNAKSPTPKGKGGRTTKAKATDKSLLDESQK